MLLKWAGCSTVSDYLWIVCFLGLIVHVLVFTLKYVQDIVKLKSGNYVQRKLALRSMI